MVNVVTKTISHPLEDALGIESGTTEVQVYEADRVELQLPDEYDTKDVEIEKQYQEIYDTAMDGYVNIAAEILVVEGKLKARMGEVSLHHLSVALNAAKAKSKLKEHKDKLELKQSTREAAVTNNTIIIGDRSDLLNTILSSIDDTESGVVIIDDSTPPPIED